jgi:adenosylhomocysteine nucleosidase
MLSESQSRIAILAPMRAELRPIVRCLSLRRSRLGDLSLFRGALGRAQIVATTTGVGTRAAARTAERVMEAMPVDHVVVVGIAGGIGPSVDIGDVVVPELVVDLATGEARRPSTLRDAVPRGTLVTSDELLTDPAPLAVLARQGVIAVDMETAAIAAACERRGCPWSVFRAISDRADDGTTDPAVFGLAGPDGSPHLTALVRFVLTNPMRVRRLASLWRGLSLATRSAAEAAVSALGKVYAA